MIREMTEEQNTPHVCEGPWHLASQIFVGNLQVSHGGGLMDTPRLLTALQQWGGYINLLGLKPLELVKLGEMRREIDASGRGANLDQTSCWD